MAAYNQEKKILTGGVTRKVMRRISPCIKQEELRSNKAHIDTRGISKAAVLKGGKKLTKLIEDSVYYTKTVHYTSMFSEKMKLVVKEKE